LLTVVLLDVCGFKILRVLDIVEDAVEGWEAIGVVCKMCLASCVDDIPCIYPGVGYFFMVAAMVVVVVGLLRPWSLVCCRLSPPLG
jgi:hypothetical protein